MQVLADFLPHKVDDLVPCLDDTLATVRNVQDHIVLLRRKLRTVGLDLHNVRLPASNGLPSTSSYQLIRLTHPINAD